MGTLSMRRGGYKVGLVIYLFGMVLFTVGFATPNWCDYELAIGASGSQSIKMTGHAGLWQSCFKVYGQSICQTSPGSGWELIVKGLEGAAMAILVLTTLFALYLHFMLNTLPTLCQEALFQVGAGFAAGLCVGGAATYATNISRDTDVIQESYLQGQVGFNFDYTLSWSFGVNIAGGVVMIIGSIPLRACSKPTAAGQQQMQQQQQLQPGFSTLNTAGMPVGASGPVLGGVQLVGDPNYPHAMYSSPPPAYGYYPTVPSAQGPEGQMVFDGPMTSTKQ